MSIDKKIKDLEAKIQKRPGHKDNRYILNMIENLKIKREDLLKQL